MRACRDPSPSPTFLAGACRAPWPEATGAVPHAFQQEWGPPSPVSFHPGLTGSGKRPNQYFFFFFKWIVTAGGTPASLVVLVSGLGGPGTCAHLPSWPPPVLLPPPALLGLVLLADRTPGFLSAMEPVSPYQLGTLGSPSASWLPALPAPPPSISLWVSWSLYFL